jgi:hypothetical protein
LPGRWRKTAESTIGAENAERVLDDDFSTFSGPQTGARPFKYLVANDLLQTLQARAKRRLTQAEMPPCLKIGA